MKCEICGSHKTISLFSFSNPRRIGNRKLSYKQCQKCGLVFLAPKLSSQKLEQIYSSQEYFTKLCQPATNSFIQKILSIRLFLEYDEFVQSNFKSSQGNLLDIGCGNGEFLYLMQKRGWDVSGADPSRVAVSNARKLVPGAKFKTGKIYDLKFSRKFDAITFWHVLEHEPRPLKFIKSLVNLVSPKGKIFLEVPNSDSLLLRLFKSDYNWLMVPEHIFYYSPSSLRYLFNRAGLRVERVDYPPRALLNFGLSVAKVVPILAPLAFLFSPVIGFLAAVLKKSEVVRITASL